MMINGKSQSEAVVTPKLSKEEHPAAFEVLNFHYYLNIAIFL
jgi:hypothetical protein